MEIPDKKSLNCNTIRSVYISKHYPEFYKFLIDNYNDCESFPERLYLSYNGLDKRPKCIICGNNARFNGFFKGFGKYCSCKCAQNDKDVRNKLKQTNIKRYGCEAPSQNNKIKEKIKRTNIERYGVENPFSSDIVRKKIKQTNLKRYGYEYNLQDPKIRERIKQTNLERYGVENVSQNESIKEKKKKTNLERYGYECNLHDPTVKEKIKQTNLERYGVENVFGVLRFKEKIKQTNIEKYRVENPKQNESIKEKIKRTNLERYGVENPIQSDIIKNKIRKNIITTHHDLIGYTKDDKWICKCPHPECNKCSEKKYITHSQLYNDRKRLGTELCTKLLPIQSSYSTPELQIRNFLDSLNIEYTTNDRSIITPKELDIYIPSKNIAIEFNGSYWHSNKDKYYHQNKTKACYSKGILLVHIYEHEWNNDKESILSKLKDVLEGKEVNGIVPIKDYDKYTLSEPILIDCGNYQYWNEGKFIRKFIRK